MRVTENIYVVGGGVWGGMGLSPGPDCNVYVIDCGGPLVLVDCGSGMSGSVDAMVANMARDGLAVDRISTILLTHKHGDHIGGAAQFAAITGARLVASAETAGVLATADEDTASITAAKVAGLYPADFALAPVAGVEATEGGARIAIGEVVFDVIDTPGHCSGHISFCASDGKRCDLFAGDAVFWRGRVIMQSVPDCGPQASASSIERLAALSRLDGLYSGHGAFVVSGAQRHIGAALEQVRALRVPPGL